MKYFIRYACAFCLTRFLWSAFRGHGQRRGNHQPAVPCEHGLTGVWMFLAGVALAPFVYGAVFAVLAVLLHW
jgi:hypothetical protein